MGGLCTKQHAQPAAGAGAADSPDPDGLALPAKPVPVLWFSEAAGQWREREGLRGGEPAAGGAPPPAAEQATAEPDTAALDQGSVYTLPR